MTTLPRAELTMDLLSNTASLLSWRSATTALIVWATYLLLKAIYHASPLDPLYKFPGPKLASMSYLYEFYYDFILWGRYSHEIKRMHGIYGMSKIQG